MVMFWRNICFGARTQFVPICIRFMNTDYSLVENITVEHVPLVVPNIMLRFVAKRQTTRKLNKITSIVD